MICLTLDLRIQKYLTKNIQHNVAQPGAITSIVEINAWFTLRIEKRPNKIAVEQHVSIMTDPLTPKVK